MYCGHGWFLDEFFYNHLGCSWEQNDSWVDYSRLPDLLAWPMDKCCWQKILNIWHWVDPCQLTSQKLLYTANTHDGGGSFIIHTKNRKNRPNGPGMSSKHHPSQFLENLMLLARMGHRDDLSAGSHKNWTQGALHFPDKHLHSLVWICLVMSYL